MYKAPYGGQKLLSNDKEISAHPASVETPSLNEGRYLTLLTSKQAGCNKSHVKSCFV